jgi:telomere length regulation protein
MDGLLEPVQTKRVVKTPLVQEVGASAKTVHNLKDPKDILNALNNEPDLHTFRTAIEALHIFDAFDVRIPSPQSTPILQVLVSDVLPNYWKQLSEDGSLKDVLKTIVECLTSLPALGAIVFRFKAILNEIAAAGQPDFVLSQAASLVELLERICDGNLFMLNVWRSLNQQAENKNKRIILWGEFVSLLAGGKLLSTVSEIQLVLQKSPDYGHNSWIADGTKYAKWLARNIEYLDRESGDKVNASRDCAQFLRKSLSLGYTGMSGKSNKRKF